MRKLNIGCGTDFMEGYMNLDMFNTDSRVYIRDVRKGLPFDDKSVDEIYSSHFLEHLAQGEEVLDFISECYRVLKPKSRLILRVPDANHRDAFMPTHKSFWTPIAFRMLCYDKYQGMNFSFSLESCEYSEPRAELQVVMVRQ